MSRDATRDEEGESVALVTTSRTSDGGLRRRARLRFAAIQQAVVARQAKQTAQGYWQFLK